MRIFPHKNIPNPQAFVSKLKKIKKEHSQVRVLFLYGFNVINHYKQ